MTQTLKKTKQTPVAGNKNRTRRQMRGRQTGQTGKGGEEEETRPNNSGDPPQTPPNEKMSTLL